MEMLKEYIAPEMEIIEINDADIIITSFAGGDFTWPTTRTTNDSKF